MIRPLSRLSHLFRWRYLRWVLAVPALPLALWACNSHPLEAPIPLPEQQNDQYYEVNPIRDIDILFMIDNSPSMAEEQNNLGRNFPAFIDELKKIPGGLPSVHIGVISSDLGAGPSALMGGCGRVAGDRGILQAKAGCGINGMDRFLKSEPNGTANPTVNFAGDLSTVFSCMAKLGTTGCGYEHQLQSTRVALYESITMENIGFLRENAFLALIFITDEDDCSADINSNLFADETTFVGTAPSFRCAQVGHVCNGMTPPIAAPFSANLADCDSNENGKLISVEEMVTSIRKVKPRPDQQIIVSGIFGWPNDPAGAQYRYVKIDNVTDFAPICESMDNGAATAGLRMKKFVESFGTSGSFFPICQNDFRPAMKQIGEKLAAKLGNPCISAPLVDTAPDTGIQADCQVVDQVPSGTSFTYTALPRCDRGSPPCWRLAADTTCNESGYKIDVDRAGVLAKPGTQQAIKCLTCASPADPRCTR